MREESAKSAVTILEADHGHKPRSRPIGRRQALWSSSPPRTAATVPRSYGCSPLPWPFEPEKSALEQESLYYRALLPEWGEQEGQHVLIQGQELVGFFPTRHAAMEEGFRRFGHVPILVKQIRQARREATAHDVGHALMPRMQHTIDFGRGDYHRADRVRRRRGGALPSHGTAGAATHYHDGLDRHRRFSHRGSPDDSSIILGAVPNGEASSSCTATATVTEVIGRDIRVRSVRRRERDVQPLVLIGGYEPFVTEDASGRQRQSHGPCRERMSQVGISTL